MSFADAESESRERLAESTALLNHIRATSPVDFTPLDDLQKSMRGLWLVSLYGAFERAVNVTVEAAIAEISGHATKSIDCVPALHSILQYSYIAALRDCGNNRSIDKSIDLFEASFSTNPASLNDNPLAERLQNVDGSTLIWVTGIFGAPGFVMPESNKGRLSRLRERRNAVAHGREAASKVGERYTLEELARVYDAADAEITRFLFHLRDYCANRGYVRRAA